MIVTVTVTVKRKKYIYISENIVLAGKTGAGEYRPLWGCLQVQGIYSTNGSNYSRGHYYYFIFFRFFGHRQLSGSTFDFKIWGIDRY